MKKNNVIYIALFFVLISPSIFNYELWPLSRYKLYSRLYNSDKPRFLGLYVTMSGGKEVFLNSENYLYPFFIFHMNLNLIPAHPNDNVPDNFYNSELIPHKLKVLLKVFNYNQTKLGLENANKISLYKVQWDQKLFFENFSQTKKQYLIKEVSLD